MSKLTTHISVLLGMLLVGGLSGCGTSPSPRLYLIQPMAMTANTTAVSGPTIAIRPVVLPEHLRRKEIVTHDAPYRVHAAAFDRWAEPLDTAIAAALTENLSILMQTDTVIAYPWDQVHGVDYAVNLRILSFAAEPGGEVALSVSWIINAADRTPLVLDKARYTEAPRGGEVVDTVAAMSRAIEQLSRDIAAALQSVLAAEPGRTQPATEGSG